MRDPRANSRQQNAVAQNGINPQPVETTNWVYVNGLGERERTNINDTDILTAIKFDKTG